MKKKKKISKVFISFLIASVLIWLLITLSKEYVTTINYPVSYIEIPQDKLLQSTPKETIDVVVKATGFKIISSKFNKKTISLSSKKLIKKSTSSYYFLSKNQLTNIQNQLHKGVEIKEIIQDSLFLELGTLTSKKVIIKPILDISYHIGYDMSKKLKVAPDSVIVSGPEGIINKINFLETAIVSLNDVKSNFTEKRAILIPENEESIKLNEEYVIIKGVVEKFTEGSFKVPFSVINLPKNIELTTLSKTVEIVFVVGLSNFNEINKDSFTVECDYNTTKKNNLTYLMPKIINKPKFVKSVKVVPNIIEFLIQK